MKATNPWITYRTRFLVKAKQLSTSLTFTDVLGRQHSGRKGDYLVESSDGVLRIAPRQIFEDIYVPLYVPLQAGQNETPEPGTILQGLETSQPCQMPRKGETLRLRDPQRALSLPSHLTRKSPQPYPDRRHPIPGFRSL